MRTGVEGRIGEVGLVTKDDISNRVEWVWVDAGNAVMICDY